MSCSPASWLFNFSRLANSFSAIMTLIASMIRTYIGFANILSQLMGCWQASSSFSLLRSPSRREVRRGIRCRGYRRGFLDRLVTRSLARRRIRRCCSSRRGFCTGYLGGCCGLLVLGNAQMIGIVQAPVVFLITPRDHLAVMRGTRPGMSEHELE